MDGFSCGIDIGSTNVKVVLADDEGRSRWVKSVATPRRQDGIGPVTDAEALVTLLETMIFEGWQAVGLGNPLKAIAAAGVGEDGICVDRNFVPSGYAIPWFDKRVMREVEELSKAFPETRVDYYTAFTKWLWLRRHRPQEFEGAASWIALTDYPSSVWAGAPFMSETIAARTGCLDVFTRQWIPAALERGGAPPLPRVLKAGQVAGTMRHGALRQAGAASAETVIVAAGHDHPIASSAIQRLSPTARIDSIGTANAIYGETMQPRPETAGTNLDHSVPARGGPGIALIGVTEFSASLLESFGGEAAVRALLAARSLAGHPPSAPPKLDALQGDTQHRLRLVLEHNGWRAASYLRAMTKLGVPHGPVFATGGWARSTALMELRASIFGEPITVVDEPELAALGAALLAAEGANGKASDFRPSRGLHQVEPNADWTETYHSWRHAT